MPQKFFKFPFSFHPNLQYSPMQKKLKSPDVSCNPENARNILRLTQHTLTPSFLPILKSASISLWYRRCLKSQSLPRTSCPVENVGRHLFCKQCKKLVSVDFPQQQLSTCSCLNLQSKLPLAPFGLRQRECVREMLSWKMSPQAKGRVNGKSWGKAGGRSVSLDQHMDPGWESSSLLV